MTGRAPGLRRNAGRPWSWPSVGIGRGPSGAWCSFEGSFVELCAEVGVGAVVHRDVGQRRPALGQRLLEDGGEFLPRPRTVAPPPAAPPPATPLLHTALTP